MHARRKSSCIFALQKREESPPVIWRRNTAGKSCPQMIGNKLFHPRLSIRSGQPGEEPVGGIVKKTVRLTSVLILTVLSFAAAAVAQTDPGVQSASRGTGAALSSVLANDKPGILDFFNDGLDRFQEVDAVAVNGLGPRFNSNSCSSCHAQPAIGGTGAAVNPQFSFAGSPVAPRD